MLHASNFTKDTYIYDKFMLASYESNNYLINNIKDGRVCISRFRLHAINSPDMKIQTNRTFPSQKKLTRSSVETMKFYILFDICFARVRKIDDFKI